MAVLPIVQTGDPVLRAEARPLTEEEIASKRIQKLIADMRDTMRAAPGVGLAAPQIGESLQLVVIEDTPDRQSNLTPEQLAERERDAVPFHVLINPKLTLIGMDQVKASEGCLSFKGFVMTVGRSRKVRVEALDEHGQPFKREASGWYARILQHECDHLKGTLCYDRMDARTLSTVENSAKQQAKK